MILKNPRNLLWILPLAVFMVSPLWIPAAKSFLKPRGGFGKEAVNLPGVEQKQQFVMDAVTITMSTAGRVEWTINADQAFTIKSDREIGMTEVDAVYEGDDKDKTLITSSSGQYDIDKGHLILIDDVVIVKPATKQEMYTDLLHYYNTSRTVVCPGDVKLLGPDFTIRAGRLDYDLAKHSYDFGGRVNVELSGQTTNI